MTKHVTVRLLRSEPGSGGAGEWLRFVWDMNETDPHVVDAPVSEGPWWAGGDVEEYEDVRLIFRMDRTVNIVGKTARGDAAILATALRWNIPCHVVLGHGDPVKF